MIGTILPLFIVSTALGQPSANSELRDPHVDGKVAAPVEQTRSRAEQGDVKAENALGIMYSKGEGVPQDYGEAVRWYRKAADRGYAKGQYNLGNMYYYGRGVPQDRVEAERWYQRASDQGDEYAQRALGSRRSLRSGGAISLWLMFLGCMWALKEAILPQGDARHRQPRALTVGGMCGLVYVGLSLYGYFNVFKTVSTVNVFLLVKDTVAGIAVALFISVWAPKKIKVALGISGGLLIVNDLIVIWRHALTRSVITVHGFSSMNGLLIGLTVPLALLLWSQYRQNRHGA